MDDNHSPKPAKSKRQNPWYIATRLLAVRPRTEGELRKRLFQKKFSADLVEKTIEQCRKYGYLDDIKFARAVCEEALRGKPIGKKMLKMKLVKFELPEDVVESALASYFTPDRERGLAVKAIERKLKQIGGKKLGREEIKIKLYRYLIGRGFSQEIISRAMEDKY